MQTKTCFESAFSLFAGFRFADAQSRENALWAALWARQAAESSTAFRPPLVVISGPMASGKSELVRRLSAQAGVLQAEINGLNMTAVAGAGGLGCRFLVIEELPLLSNKRACNELCSFIAAREWKHRSLSAKKVTLACLTVVTMCVPDLPADLERRAIHIRLVDRKPAAAGKITAKRGLLWRGGKVISLPEADVVARAHGFLCAERMVDALAAKKGVRS